MSKTIKVPTPNKLMGGKAFRCIKEIRFKGKHGRSWQRGLDSLSLGGRMHELIGIGGGCDGAKQKISKEQSPMRLNARQVLWKRAEGFYVTF